MRLVLECCDDNWKNFSLLSEPVGESTNTSVCEFTDSVLCLGGRCQGYRGSVKEWKHTSKALCKAKNTENFMILQVIRCASLGEFVQDIPPRLFSTRSRKMIAEKATSPSEFQGKIIFMRMFTDIEWWTKQNELKCLQNAVLKSHTSMPIQALQSCL